MEESWDDVTWEKDVQLKEWYVEYIAIVNDQKKSPHVYTIRRGHARRSKKSTS